MSMIIKKRTLIIATLVVSLAAAIFVNWYYTRPQIKSTSGKVENTTIVSSNVEDEGSLGDAKLVNATANEYFASAKLKRNEAHDEALDALNKIIKDSSSNQSAISNASKALEELTKAFKLEADIENLITAKTGSESLVTLNEKKINVVVQKGTINETVNTQIMDIIIGQDEKYYYSG